MTDRTDGTELGARIDAILPRLLVRAPRLAPDNLARLIADETARVGLEACVLLVDLDQSVLNPLPPAPAQLGPQDVDGTLAGRAFQVEKPVLSSATEDGTTIVWLPLVDGTERLGVLYLRLPVVSDDLIDRCEPLTRGIAELLVSKSQYGDTLHLARRTQPMALAAELRWSMLPPLTFNGERAGIACVLEPAYEVAGDAFDYAMNGNVLHIAIFDAMGHGLEASRMATLATGAYRLARRSGLDLSATFALIDEAITDQFGSEHFVTAQLATLDDTDGTLCWVNAGHPHPLLLRQGRLASELVSDPSLPLGLGDVPTKVAEASLEPGDSLLFFTDGIVEARSPGGERFGQERLVDLTRRALAGQQTLAETVRRLARSVSAHREGPLSDDATVLLVDWHPS